jgi:hypothetical protein
MLDCSSDVTLQRAVDILFVIDNSGSMGEEQGTLAANFAAFIDVLESDQIGANYRIGVTTTDELGLRASSCRQRLSEFIWEGELNGQQIYVNAQQDGCLNSCLYDEISLLPVEIGEDATAVRPWLEKNRGRSNLPPDIAMTDALQCLGPQGIDGFGFEGPLESMRRVLVDEPQGFVRDSALLAVIFVTDEADCSMPSNHQSLISGELARPLWSDPYGDRPTSAVCWNAGVECVGGPGVYETCYAQDKGWDASPAAEGDAVLYSISRYVDTLRDVARGKEVRGGNGQVLVAVIAGVPEDYPDGGTIVYQDSALPDFNREYGIGPGCDRGTESVGSPPGIPPVRLREFAEAFAVDRRNLFSICSDDYTVALEQIADAIANLSQRACVPGCVSDAVPNVRGLQPNCLVREQTTAGDERDVDPCIVTNDGWLMPGGADVCYRTMGDKSGQTRTPADDMTAQCVTLGANLEVALERMGGAPAPAGSAVRVDCDLAGPIGTTCQEIGL